MAMVKNLGLSTNELEKGMQTNAVGTILKSWMQLKMPEIAAKGGTSQIDAVATLFGAEHWDTFSKLLKTGESLKNNYSLQTVKTPKGQWIVNSWHVWKQIKHKWRFLKQSIRSWN